jgi:hypothetical protein
MGGITRGRGCRALVLTSASVLASTLNTPAADATASGLPQVCLCIAIDGSGSISAADFSLVRSGLANVVNDAAIVPRDTTMSALICCQTCVMYRQRP